MASVRRASAFSPGFSWRCVASRPGAPGRAGTTVAAPPAAAPVRSTAAASRRGPSRRRPASSTARAWDWRGPLRRQTSLWPPLFCKCCCARTLLGCFCLLLMQECQHRGLELNLWVLSLFFSPSPVFSVPSIWKVTVDLLLHCYEPFAPSIENLPYDLHLLDLLGLYFYPITLHAFFFRVLHSSTVCRNDWNAIKWPKKTNKHSDSSPTVNMCYYCCVTVVVFHPVLLLSFENNKLM